MGIGPLMPWRRASREHLRNNFLIPVAGTRRRPGRAVRAGRARSVRRDLGFGLCLFVLGTIVQEFVRGALARHHATGENYVAALGSLIRRNNRRYGGYLVHLAILLIGAGAVGSQIYQQQTQATLAPGESVTPGRLHPHRPRHSDRPTAWRQGHRGRADVNGERSLRPEKHFFDNFPQQPSTKVGLRSTPFEDLYVVLGGLGRRRRRRPRSAWRCSSTRW